MTADAAKWLKAKRIDDVECMVPDLTGIARGKILPRERFLASLKSASAAVALRVSCNSGKLSSTT